MATTLEKLAANIADDWRAALEEEFREDYFAGLSELVDLEERIAPPREDIFKALELTPLGSVKACIIGQDPYPTPGVACGLAFSTRAGVKRQRSEIAIFRALEADGYAHPEEDGDLSEWARRGVLLLNTALTTREGEAGAHLWKGWERFTSAVLEAVKAKEEPVAFLLWGDKAIKAAGEIPGRHLAIESRHPSPLANNRKKGRLPKLEDAHAFAHANEFLEGRGASPIDWSL